MDVFSKKKRSWIMGRIRSKNTKPEIIVRSMLHRMGFRFSLRRTNLPGSPDIVLPKHRTLVFVHGCFWHRHKGCKIATMPKTRKDFWKKKFDRNVERDRKNLRELRRLGWKVIVIWECQLRKPAMLVKKLEGIFKEKRKETSYSLPAPREFFKAAEKKADYNRPAKDHRI